MEEQKNHRQVQEYYGKTLQNNSDLKTNACCLTDAMPQYLRPLLQNVHEEIKDRFYGCGSPIPLALQGAKVLDLGCGTGRDVYLLAQLVGEEGEVHGVDMTEEQLSFAQEYQIYHQKKFGYSRNNVHFHHGYIEDLQSLALADNSFDCVVSNCVINLSDDKEKVFSEIFRILKPGGELYFSDIFSQSRIPEVLKKDPILRGECLAGAMYIEDFRRLLDRKLACPDFRIISRNKVEISETEVFEKIGMIQFESITVRAFKTEVEDRCEDFGQFLMYEGGIQEAPFQFILDDHHHFIRGKAQAVCGNTADMIMNSRYAPYFKLFGDKTQHFGLFDCGSELKQLSNEGACC